MNRCAACNHLILWGGEWAGSDRFCGMDCLHSWPLFSVSSELPDNLVREHAEVVFAQECPRCGGRGPVDVHFSSYMWSLVVYSSIRSVPIVACRRCAHRRQAVDALGTLLCGWWSFPVGVLGTPIVVGRNLLRMMLKGRRAEPSKDLLRLVRLRLAADMGRKAGERIRS